MAATSPPGARPRELAGEVERLVTAHEAWRARCLNLDAAESLSSARSTRVLASDLAQRACPGPIGRRNHRGARYVDAIETHAAALLRRLLGARHVELQIPSGSLANGLALRALTEVGDPILRIQRPRAHPTFDADGFAGHRGLRIHDVAVDRETFTVDLDRLRDAARRVRPRLICLGSAVMLFPYPVGEIAAIAEEVGARVLYDGAHVLGLIAAGRFQRPLAEGAAVLTGTSYKSFSGPLGGLVATDDDALDARLRTLLESGGYVGTYNHARVAALAIAAAEQLEHGPAFADAMVANARTLARALDAAGLRVLGREHGYTATSAVFVDVGEHGGGTAVSERLEAADIITMGMRLWDEPGRDGLRLATHEVTRLGLGEPEMLRIAELVRRVVLDGEAPDAVRGEVHALRGERAIAYSFDLEAA